VVVHAPADEVASRITPAAGHVEARDAGSCVLHTGSDSLESVAVHLGMLGVDFEVVDPPELVDHITLLAERYARAVRRG
jgi:predicted DNA-binding transcriptional regulator YafY